MFLKKRYIISSCSFKKRREFFDNLLPKNYFAAMPKQKSTCEGVIRKKCYFEERSVELEVGCNAIIHKGLPKKSKDPRSFKLHVSIALSVDKALLDLETNINLIPFAMLKKK